MYLLLPLLTQATAIEDFSPLSHWTCDETSGVRYDSNTVTGNDLTDNDTVGYGTGLLGNACDFEQNGGHAEYLSISDANQTGLDFTGDFTFSFWVDRETNTDALMVGKDNGDGQRGYNIMLDCGADNTDVCMYDSTETPWLIDADVTLNGWYHIVAVNHTNSWCLFVNAVHIGCNDIGTISDSNAYFALGRTQIYSTNFYDGLLDEMTVFDEAIATTTVTALYNSGTPLSYAGSGTSSPATSTSATSTSTFEDDNIVFALAVVIFFLTFIWFGFIVSAFKKV